MERIIRFRDTQRLTLDEFIEQVLDKPTCAYCKFYDECSDDIGYDISEVITEGCSNFDNSIVGLKEIYLKQMAVKKS
jgi:hypothetical protein